jgi:hypothetical protein
LRKYARTVQQQFLEGAPEPLRLSEFLAVARQHSVAASGMK